MPNTHRGLVLKPKQPDHWEMGQGKLSARFGAETLNPTGDWTPYKAEDEHQSRGMFDTDCCWIFSTLKPWIMVAKLLGFKDYPQNISERYVAVMANATPYGGDPHDAAEVVRTISGVIPEAILPFTDEIRDFQDFIHPKPMDPVIAALGRASLDKWVHGYEWVFAWGNTYTPAQKTQMIAEAAKRGAVAYSVDGNYRRNHKKQLTKPVGGQDTHWVTHLKSNADGTKQYHDQYEPFIETVEKDYDHNAAILYILSRNANPMPQKSFWGAFAASIWASFAQLWSKAS